MYKITTNGIYQQDLHHIILISYTIYNIVFILKIIYCVTRKNWVKNLHLTKENKNIYFKHYQKIWM